ncbi:hypothetical protein NQ318_017448, partial [Aromia moschata]
KEVVASPRKSSTKTLKYSLMFLGVSVTLVGGYIIFEYSRPDSTEEGDVVDENSNHPFWKQYLLKGLKQIKDFTVFIQEPSREKLLPDPVSYPYYQPPYTLVLEFTDVLAHPDWTYKTGWRFKKRPGLDYMLENLVGLYEIVVFTAEPGMTIFPVIEALDQKNLISYKLVRDSTHFVEGHHVKNLDKLNRDLKKIVVVDWNAESVRFHPDNHLNIQRWRGEDGDTALIDLTSFLKTIAHTEIDDVREVLKFYKQYDDPLLEFRNKQKEYYENQDQNKTLEKPKSPPISKVFDYIMKLRGNRTFTLKMPSKAKKRQKKTKKNMKNKFENIDLSVLHNVHADTSNNTVNEGNNSSFPFKSRQIIKLVHQEAKTKTNTLQNNRTSERTKLKKGNKRKIPALNEETKKVLLYKQLLKETEKQNKLKKLEKKEGKQVLLNGIEPKRRDQSNRHKLQKLKYQSSNKVLSPAETPRESEHTIQKEIPVNNQVNKVLQPSEVKKKQKMYKKLQGLLNQEQESKKPILSLRQKMMDKLKAARFRFLNEQIYTTTSKEAQKIFQSDPDAFVAYHRGYRQQVKSWPLNPLDVIIAKVRKLPKDHIVADFGCGEAKLAKSVQQKVYSFDLVAVDDSVVACDMSRVPLSNESADVAVFCLSLMGTNLQDYLLEANRILKVGGTLKIAEVESRFEDVDNFIEGISRFGFKKIWMDLSHDLFYFMDFRKVMTVKNKKKVPTMSLLPCLYKKR